MRYLDDSKLKQIADAILNLSATGLKIHCILELFQCQTELENEEEIHNQVQIQNQNQQIQNVQNNSSNNKSNSNSMSSSSAMLMSFTPQTQIIQAFPEIAMRERQNRKTYIYLTQCLQKVYQDQQILTLVTPQSFFEIEYTASLNTINSTLMASIQNYQSIQKYLMLAIQDACPNDQTRVYTCDLSQSNYNFFEGDDGVWSQNFMFYNLFKKRILIFVLKAVPQICNEVDNEGVMEEDYDPKYLNNQQEYDEAFPQGSKFYDLV